MDVCERTQWNLLACRRANQQVADLGGVLAEFGFHAHHQIEKLLALDDLGCRLSANSRLDNRLNVSHVDAVPGNLVAIDIDKKAWLAKFANHCEFGKTRYLREPALDLECFALKSIQVG